VSSPAGPPDLQAPPRLLGMLHEGRPATPPEIEAAITAVLVRIDQGVAWQTREEQRLQQLETAYDLAYARALLAAPKGAADVRKAHAVLALEQQQVERDVQRSKVKVMREAMHNLRSLQSGLQTIARSVNASLQGGGSVGPDRDYRRTG
jgi:hypothetical protein